MSSTAQSKLDIPKKTALKFIIALGIVSLFADMTYEGARSIMGPYLAVLGAKASVVGFVAGFGEFLGYGLRLISGYIADRTAKYWAIIIMGYALNLLAVPLLALAGYWQVAALLMILERTGKAIRTPARDAMLSHAGNQTGMGWGFGLHEAMDQTGAMLGPLLVAGVLYFQHSYRESFAILLIPALIALVLLALARWSYPHPQRLEIKIPSLERKGITPLFWIYLAGSGLIGAGYADFALISYHFEKTSVMPPIWIPITYAIAMGMSGITAPVLGILYDRLGIVILMIITAIAALFAPLAFFGGFMLAILGVVLWSIGIGAQESLMRAIVAHMAPKNKRASAYGIFNGVYGLCWFLGSFLMGVLYDVSTTALVVFSLVMQLASLPLLWLVMKRV